jgi:hypothetical protein
VKEPAHLVHKEATFARGPRPTTQTVETVRRKADVDNATDAILNCTLIKGKTTRSPGKFYSAVIDKIILLYGFPLDSNMVRYIDQ